MTAALVAPAEGEHNAMPENVDWDRFRMNLGQLAFNRGYYAGVPLPVDGAGALTLEPKHPLRAMLEGAGRSPATCEFTCSTSDVNEEQHIRSRFWVKRERREVIIYTDGPGQRIKWIWDSPYELEEHERCSLMMRTLLASGAYPIEAEFAAQERLAELTTTWQFRSYLMTGMFSERSKRSQARYIFRRQRPTLVMLPWNPGEEPANPVCALCMHPVGYYERSFAGAMVPTDDIIAHLLLMRADEHEYWRRSNQHSIWRKEAGV